MKSRAWRWGLSAPALAAMVFAVACSSGDDDQQTGNGAPNAPGSNPVPPGAVMMPGATPATPVGPSTPATGNAGSGAAPAAGGSAATGGAPANAGSAANTGVMQPTAGSGSDSEPSGDGMRDVLLVGNGVEGSVSFVDVETFENLGKVDVLSDRDEVMSLISADLVRSAAFAAVKHAQLLHHFQPSGGDRFLYDVVVSPVGTPIYVSRSNLGDVAAFDLTKADHPRIWRTFVDGLKADHATISPDGEKLIVSATTATVADVIDAEGGAIMGSFPTGDFPHQNDYSADGKHIYNSSIGNVGYEAVSYANNAAKGNRWLVQVDASSLQVLKTWKFDYGIRPSVVTADETTLYANLSYLNGAIKYDLTSSKEIARSDQPLSEFAMSTYASYDEYPHDSAHHGLALSADGKKLCDCGTIDNTVSIVTTADMKVSSTIEVGMIPYWATNSPDGKYCFVSLSGSDAVSVIDYDAEQEVKMVPVGKFPQRSRLGRVPQSVIDLLQR
jgi:YVTN family beta-propeller protein